LIHSLQSISKSSNFSDFVIVNCRLEEEEEEEEVVVEEELANKKEKNNTFDDDDDDTGIITLQM
jgi:hypothetical protein